MKRIIKILLVIVILATSACNANGGKVFDGKMGEGKVMSLTFLTNPSTGFEWEYKFENGDAEITLDREDYKMNENMEIVGAADTVIYYFKATKEGKSSLVFTYRRPWEGGNIAYDVVYELQVDKNMNISCLSKMKGVVESDVELSYFPNPIFTNE